MVWVNYGLNRTCVAGVVQNLPTAQTCDRVVPAGQYDPDKQATSEEGDAQKLPAAQIVCEVELPGQ